MSENLKLYKAFKILFLTMIINPIFIFYATKLGLDASQIFLLTSIETITIILLEVPTGIISDLWGCKISIILSIISYMFANIIYAFKPGFIGFCFASVLIALYKVLISGADESYLYLGLKEESLEGDYSKISGNIDSINFFFNGIFSISIGYIYEFNNILPFIISIIFSSISLIIVFRLKNIKDKKNVEKTKLESLYKKYYITLKDGIEEIKTSRILWWFMIFSTIVSFSLVAITNMYQFYFIKMNIPIEYYGFIYLVLYIVSSVSSRYAYKLKNIKNIFKIFFILLILLLITPLAMSTLLIPFIIFITIPRIVIGSYPVLIKEFINIEIKSNRATIFSIRSLIMRIPQVILLPAIGVIIDKLGIQLGLIICSISISFLTVILFLIYKILKINNIK